MDKEIKLARIKAKSENYRATINLLREVLDNPAAELIGGVALIEMLGRGSNPLFSYKAQDRLVVGLAVAVMMQQLGGDNTAKLLQAAGGGVKQIMLAPIELAAKVLPVANLV